MKPLCETFACYYLILWILLEDIGTLSEFLVFWPLLGVKVCKFFLGLSILLLNLFTRQIRCLAVSVVIIFGLLEFMGIALLKGKHYLLRILQDQSYRVCLVSSSVSSV